MASSSNAQIFQRNGSAKRGSSVRIKGSRARAHKVWAVRGLGDMISHPSAHQSRHTGVGLMGGNNTVARDHLRDWVHRAAGMAEGFTSPTPTSLARGTLVGGTTSDTQKNKTMMATYLERTNGRVHLSKILQAAGKQQTDLPTLPQYVHPNGRP